MIFTKRGLQLAGIATLIALLVIAGVQSCSGGSSDGSASRATKTGPETDPDTPSRSLTKIVGTDQDGFFQDEAGNRFFPWGLNYVSTPAIGLIDDNIHSDAAWQTIESDFAEMAGYDEAAELDAQADDDDDDDDDDDASEYDFDDGDFGF